MKQALFIMAKEPIPGKVKTRLCPPLTYEQAAEFYRCFLLDVFASAQKLSEMEELKPLDLFVAYHPKTSVEVFQHLAPSSFQFFPQEGEGLTERLKDGFGRLFAGGYSTVGVLGGDSPTLDPQELVPGFLLLEKSREKLSLVIKPSLDGGYCFLALNRFHPEIFEGIDWSSERVFAQTTQKAEQAGINWHSLAPWYDLDTVEDFKFLEELLEKKEGKGSSWRAGQNTLEFFKTQLYKLRIKN